MERISAGPPDKTQSWSLFIDTDERKQSRIFGNEASVYEFLIRGTAHFSTSMAPLAG